MGTHKVVVGEFENAYYANVARRDLLNAGIETSIRVSKNFVVQPRQVDPDAVRLIVDQDQLELAEKILVKKFVDKLAQSETRLK